MPVDQTRLRTVGHTEIHAVTYIGDETDNNLTWPGGDLDEDRVFKLIQTFMYQFRVASGVTDLNFGINLVGANNFASAVYSRYVGPFGSTGAADAFGNEWETTINGEWLAPAEPRAQLRGLILPPGIGLTLGVGESAAGSTFDFTGSMLVATARDPHELWPFIGNKGGISNAIQ